jgi:hypothetical protein
METYSNTTLKCAVMCNCINIREFIIVAVARMETYSNTTLKCAVMCNCISIREFIMVAVARHWDLQQYNIEMCCNVQLY